MENMSELRKVIYDIMNCPNIGSIYKGETNDCNEIINCQRIDFEIGLKDFKGPEAWNGNINKSQVLVISSNPGLGKDEVIPTVSWSLELATDFYQNRFNKDKNWVKDLRPRQYPNGHHKRKISNWTQTQNRMKYILGHEVEIGIDYTLLELVHCKSCREKGVSKAFNECTRKYFERIMRLSPAKLIVVTGYHAINFFCNEFKITYRDDMKRYGLYSPQIIAGSERVICFLPHTNYYGKRKAQYYLNSEDVERIRSFLRT